MRWLLLVAACPAGPVGPGGGESGAKEGPACLGSPSVLGTLRVSLTSLTRPQPSPQETPELASWAGAGCVPGVNWLCPRCELGVCQLWAAGPRCALCAHKSPGCLLGARCGCSALERVSHCVPGVKMCAGGEGGCPGVNSVGFCAPSTRPEYRPSPQV